MEDLISGKINVFTLEKQYIRKDLSSFWGKVASTLVRDQDGNPDYFIAFIEDNDQQKQAEKEHKKLQAVYDQNLIGLAINSPDGRFLKVNQQYCNFIGYTEEELLQMSSFDITLPSFNPLVDKIMNQLIGGDIKVFNIEKQYIKKDNTIIWGKLSGTLVWDHDGNPDYFIALVEDITNQKLAYGALEEAKSEAVNANQAKTAFISTLSHELRNPLTSIIGYSEMFIKELFGPLSSEQLKAISTILESGRYLTDLITDMFDISLIESGHLNLNPEWISIKKIVDDVLEMFHDKAIQHSLKIKAEIPENLTEIWSDEKRVKQILINLLSNAVKFTPEGGQIGIIVEETYDQIIVSVKDTGIGIAEENLPKLFQPFQRIDSQLNKKIEGTGIGLCLSKYLVEIMGGQIWVESELGKGSIFSFSLPKPDQ
jgi:PAS domain S-box-containing protein